MNNLEAAANNLETLRFELADGVARVTFNRPDAGAGLSVAAGPTWAFGAAKELVMRSFSEDLESQMEFESQAIANAARTEDAAEGIAAFFEKRRASFRGR